eukprot:2431702-Amphidinium_carterae.1
MTLHEKEALKPVATKTSSTHMELPSLCVITTDGRHKFQFVIRSNFATSSMCDEKDGINPHQPCNSLCRWQKLKLKLMLNPSVAEFFLAHHS